MSIPFEVVAVATGHVLYFHKGAIAHARRQNPRKRKGRVSSIVDVRSLSPVGGSHFGVNAKRVRAYLLKLASI